MDVTVEEQFSHCINLVSKLSRSIKNNAKVSFEVKLLVDALIKLSKEYNEGPKLAEPTNPIYGLYDDHKMDYGVPLPDKDISWLTQTK
jgi:hypothetical protein